MQRGGGHWTQSCAAAYSEKKFSGALPVPSSQSYACPMLLHFCCTCMCCHVTYIEVGPARLNGCPTSTKTTTTQFFAKKKKVSEAVPCDRGVVLVGGRKYKCDQRCWNNGTQTGLSKTGVNGPQTNFSGFLVPFHTKGRTPAHPKHHCSPKSQKRHHLLGPPNNGTAQFHAHKHCTSKKAIH